MTGRVCVTRRASIVDYSELRFFFFFFFFWVLHLVFLNNLFSLWYYYQSTLNPITICGKSEKAKGWIRKRRCGGDEKRVRLRRAYKSQMAVWIGPALSPAFQRSFAASTLATYPQNAYFSQASKAPLFQTCIFIQYRS